MLPCGSRCAEIDPSGGCNANYPYECACRRFEVAYCDVGGGGGPVFPSPPPSTPLYYVKRLQVAMADGSTHEFRASDTPVSCGTNQSVCTPDMNGTYLAVDGSGMKLVKTSSGSTLFMPDGSRYRFPVGNSADGTYADQYIDADGNTLSFSRTTANNLTTNKWTDTMGREIVDPMPYNWITQTQRPGTQEVDLPGFDGDTQKYFLKWSRLKPVQCETSTDANCGAVNGVVDGALENQSEKLFYETKYECRGNISTDLYAQSSGEVLFPEQESGVRPCNGFNILRNSSGEPILDGNGQAIPISTRFNPVVLSEAELPNGKKYEFKYNRYGEITKITYPTGSFETFVYDEITPMNGAGKPAYDQTNRGVVERKVYQKNVATPDQTWTYSAGLVSGSYKVTTYSSTGSNPTVQVKRNERFLHPSSIDNNFFGFNEPLAGFPKEELSYDENQVLRSRTLTEYVTKDVQISGYGTFSRDPRVKQTVSMAIENGLALASLSETEYNESTTTGNNAQTDPEYFSHLNVKRTKGYHYAVIDVTTAQTGSLATIASYFNQNLLASVAETDYLYDANYKARGISSLTTETRVLNPQNTSEVIAKTQTVYDNLAPAANSNYPSGYSRENYGISGSFQCPVNTSQTTTCWTDPSSSYRGKPTTVRLWDNDNNIWHESHTRYDIFGNVVKVKDAVGNEVTTEFANSTEKPYLFAYPTKVITPAPDPTNTTGTNQTSTAETTYDLMTGLPLEVKDDFGQITKTEYNDSLLRPTRTFADNFPAPESQTIYDDTNLKVTVRKQLDANGNWDEATTFMDSLGRTVKTQAKDSQGDVFVETEYDFLGRTKRVSNPYRLSNDVCFQNNQVVCWTATTYDEMSRVKFVATPDNAVVESQYALSTSAEIGMATTVIDQAGKKRRSITNALGQLIRVDEPSSTDTLNPLPVGSPSPNPTPNPTPTPPIEPPTCYSGGGQNCLNGGTNDYPSVSTYYYYTPLGDLKKVLQGEQERTFTYDSMKRLKSATNPESGTITYNYDASSNLIEKTDARGVKTHYGYDKLNRIVSRSYTDETGYQTPQVNYYYDGVNSNQSVPFGKGKLTKVTSSISTTEYTSFDGLGRVLAHKQTTDGNDYTTSYVYNLSGALIEETYPSNRVVKNTLDTDGDLSQVQSKRANETFKNYANGFTYTNWGAVSAMRLGNGRWENTQFNSRLQPVQIGLGASATNQSLLKLNYDYGTTDNNGNIKSQQIGFQGLAQLFIQTYQYDSLNRLKSATETQNNAQTWKQSFTFDRYGNRRFDTTNNNTTTLTPNCPTNICNPEINQQNNRLIGYQFDSSGNTTQDAESRQFIYDGENKQVEVKDQYGTSIGKYFYDGDGRRVKKISALEITIFVYNGGGKLVAEYSTELSQTPQVSYLTNDHLGSPRINTNQLGQVTARHDYLPFGEEIYRQGQGTDKVRQKFTSYERDNETELDFGQARYYSSKLGRFYSVDPENYQAFSDISNPQSWNAYAYVNNNPCKYADPTGTCICLGQRFSNWWNGYGFSSDKQVEEEYQKRVAFLKGLQEYNSTINGVPVNTDNMTRKQIWDNAESIADYMRKHPQEFQRVEVEVNEDGTPQSTPEITINPPDFPGRGSTKSRPSFPPNVNRGLLNKVLRGEAPRESLSAAEREIAAKFYEQTAKTTGGTMPNATRLFNEARANYLRNGGTPPGKIGDWMKRNNIPKN